MKAITACGAKTLEIIFISDYQAHGLFFADAINDLLDTFPNTVHIMLNIEPQIEKIVLHFTRKYNK